MYFSRMFTSSYPASVSSSVHSRLKVKSAHKTTWFSNLFNLLDTPFLLDQFQFFHKMKNQLVYRNIGKRWNASYVLLTFTDIPEWQDCISIDD